MPDLQKLAPAQGLPIGKRLLLPCLHNVDHFLEDVLVVDSNGLGICFKLPIAHVKPKLQPTWDDDEEDIFESKSICRDAIKKN